MSGPHSGKRPGSRTTGTNTLITAASLALTLSGWAVLTANEASPVAPVAVSYPAPAPAVSVELAPLPTLVPAPDWNAIPSRSAEDGEADAPAPAAAPPAPRRVAPPVRAVAPAPADPPQPVTTTRSSS